MNEYLKFLRSKIGSALVVHPAARILVENSNGEFLFIRRKDNGNLGIPSGGFDLGEDIETCIKRELQEETGLIADHVMPIGITSNPDSQSVVYGNGDKVQYFTIEFYSNSYSGEIDPIDTDEVDHAFFGSPDLLADLPPNERVIKEVWDYFQEHGKIKLG